MPQPGTHPLLHKCDLPQHACAGLPVGAVPADCDIELVPLGEAAEGAL
jgi:hypothetical protein